MWKSVRLRVRERSGEVRREMRDRLPDSGLTTAGDSEAVEDAFAVMLLYGGVVLFVAKREIVVAKSFLRRNEMRFAVWRPWKALFRSTDATNVVTRGFDGSTRYEM